MVFSQFAAPESTWLSLSMVPGALSTTAEETSEDASTSSEQSSVDLTQITDKPELESFCSRPDLALSSALDDTVVRVSCYERLAV